MKLLSLLLMLLLALESAPLWHGAKSWPVWDSREGEGGRAFYYSPQRWQIETAYVSDKQKILRAQFDRVASEPKPDFVAAKKAYDEWDKQRWADHDRDWVFIIHKWEMHP